MILFKKTGNQSLWQMVKAFFRLFYQHPSLIMILLMALTALVGWFFYVHYYLEVQERRVDISKIIQIDKVLLDKITKEWTRRENNLQNLASKDYNDPFLSSDNKLPQSLLRTIPPDSGSISSSSSENFATSTNGAD